MIEWAIVPLWYGGRVYSFAVVDEEDLDWLSRWRWRTDPLHRMTDEPGYATRTGSNRQTTWVIPMHRDVLGLERGNGKIVHHLNGHKRDNRKANLHVCANRSEHARFHSPEGMVVAA